ncbi:CheY-like superfamily [Scheffersomyces coipomensis]|uniref:CheY-like superfamily n=1 Tax=Scheffersomyces coipomensis TaxID=1788519 RepID=UPI00315D5751
MLDMESKQYTHPYMNTTIMSNTDNKSKVVLSTATSTSMSTTRSSSSSSNSSSQSSQFCELLLPTPSTPFYYSTSLPNNIHESNKTDYFSIIKPKLSISTVGSISSSSSPTHLLNQDQIQLNSPPLDYNSSSSSNSPMAVQEEDEEDQDDLEEDEIDEETTFDDQSIYSDSILLNKKFFQQHQHIPAFQLPVEPQQIISPVEEDDDDNEGREQALSSMKQIKPIQPRINHNPFKFLIIDDNLINIKILEKILHRLYPNATIKKLQDSTKAMSFLNNHSFDMLFLDIEMPQVSGIEIASRLRRTHHQHHHHSTKDFKNMGIIAVTTRSLPMDVKLYKDIGVDFTFSKPLGFNYDYFSSKIDEIIDVRGSN